MKISGSEIAKAAMRKKENASLEKEGDAEVRDQEQAGNHIEAMLSLIEAIHHKDPEMAHKHMMDYASKATMKKEM